MDVGGEIEEVREAWGRLRRFFGDTKHDPAKVGQVLAWVRSYGERAEQAVLNLIAYAKTRDDSHAALLHAVEHGYAHDKAKTRRPGVKA